MTVADENGKDATSVCNMLESIFPRSVFRKGTEAYREEAQAIWSQAAWLSPFCVFAPSSAQELSLGMSILARNKTPFAVRSGGHMPAKGHASSEDGILIAMSRLDMMTLAAAANEFNVPYLMCGPAHTWKNIYDFLEPHNLIAIGGRVASVGTSLILGGGISYFSNMYGWAANNVVNFEVVLADGSVVNANKNVNPDLFWALKGGSNNFGVITRYDVRVYDAKTMWGGAVAWDSSKTAEFMNAQTQYMLPGGGSDDAQAGIMSNIEIDATGSVTSGAMLVHQGSVTAPSAFEPFMKIAPTFSTLGPQKFAHLIAPTDIYGARDKRSLFASTSLMVTPLTMQLVHDELVATRKLMLSGTDCSVGAGVQPITQSFLRVAKELGGDAMDLDPDEGGFSVVLLYAYWTSPSSDTLLSAWAESTVYSIEKKAKSLGIFHPFKFLNDAGAWQNPLATYGGGKSLERLMRVSAKYDPEGVFQKLVGGFKISP